MRSRPLLCAGLLALFMAGVVSASGLAASRWSTPRVLAANAGRAVRAVGVDVGSSHAVVAWASDRGVFAAVAGVNGRFGVPQRLSRVGVGNDTAQVLAADARGDAIVLWQRPYHDDPYHGLAGSLFAAHRRAGERFGAARRLARNALSGLVALDRRGNAVIAWDQLSGRGDRSTIDVVDRHADGRYGPIDVIARGRVTLSGLAVDPAGQVVVVWASGAFPDTGVQAATRQPGGQFGAPVTIAPATPGALAGPVGIDDAGEAVIAWDGPYDGSPTGDPYRHVQVTPLTVGATSPGASQTLLAPALGQIDSLPQINVDGAGDALVAWQANTRDRRSDKLVVARSARGLPFADPITIGASCFGCNFDSAIGPHGQAIIAWDSLTAPVRAAIAMGPATPFGPAASLTRKSDSAAPAVAIGSGGHAIGIWWELSTPSYLRYASTR